MKLNYMQVETLMRVTNKKIGKKFARRCEGVGFGSQKYASHVRLKMGRYLKRMPTVVIFMVL